MARKLNSKSQVAIFVIIALLIIIVTILFFVLKQPPKTEIPKEMQPQAYIESCTKEAVEKAVEIISENGGDLNVNGGMKHLGINRTYLCYNFNNYQTCINQRPMLIKHIEHEISSYAEPRIEDCFQALEKNLENKYDVSMDNENEMDLEIKLNPREVDVEINRNLILTKQDKTIKIENFKVNIVSSIYDLAQIAMIIVNQESEFCYFENQGFALTYPSFEIEKYDKGGQARVYKVSKKNTGENFVFAVRSCAMPAGFL